MIDNPLDKIKGALEFFGSESTLDIIQYTLQRDALDARYFRNGKSSEPSIGDFLGLDNDGKQHSFRFRNARLVIRPLGPSIISIEWIKEGQSSPVIDFSQAWEHGDVPVPEAVENPDSFTIPFRDVVLTVRKNGDIDFFSSAGEKVRKDYPPVFQSDGFRHSVEITSDAGIFGFGEKAFPLNLRGRSFSLWNRDADGKYGSGSDPLYLNIPVYLSYSGKQQYLCFYENSSQATFDVGNTESNMIVGDFMAGPPKYYMIFGDLGTVYENYAKLTGFPQLPPEWSFGFHQSRWSYMDSGEVQEIADGFRQNDLPISSIHLDIDYMDGFRVFTFDSDRFARMNELTRKLRDDGVNVVTIIDPAIKWDPGYEIFNEGIDNDFFTRTPDGNVLYAPVWPGSAAFPDFSNPDVRKWWGSKYSGLLEAGISGFWHDMNEPAAFVLWGDNSLPLCAVHHAGPHLSVHNTYGLFMAQAAHEFLHQDIKGRRPFILSRAGWAGQQKYSWIWTGDSESTWEELKQTVPTILGLSLSGIPFTGSDTGGFSGDPSNELFLRWFQMSSFLPFFRTHSAKGFPMREPWKFGEPYLSIMRKFLKNRYRLIPYIYSESYHTHMTGHPLIKPVFWADGSASPSETETEYMLGDSILVAPVTVPNASQRSFHLPAGRWYDYWNPDRYQRGGAIITEETDIHSIPVFVKESAIIPAAEDSAITLDLFFPESPGTFGYELYSDDSIIGGMHRKDTFAVTETADSIEISWTKKGDYGWRYERISIRLHGRSADFAESETGEVMLESGCPVIEGMFEYLKIRKKRE